MKKIIIILFSFFVLDFSNLSIAEIKKSLESKDISNIAKTTPEVDSILQKWNTFADDENLKSHYIFVQKINLPEKSAYIIKYDSPKDKYKRFYRYLFVDKKEYFIYEISLGSYDGTTDIAREVGDIGKNQRYYHLDLYCPAKNDNITANTTIKDWGGHKSIGFFKFLPKLEEVTQTIQELDNINKTKNFCK